MSGHRYSVFGRTIHDTGDTRKELRINRKGREYARLDDAADAARKKALRFEIMSLCYEFFFIAGLDNNGTRAVGKTLHDEIFYDVVEEALNKYRSAETPLTHYIRYLYPRRVLDAGDKVRREQDRLQSFDVMRERGDRNDDTTEFDDSNLDIVATMEAFKGAALAEGISIDSREVTSDVDEEMIDDLDELEGDDTDTQDETVEPPQQSSEEPNAGANGKGNSLAAKTAVNPAFTGEQDDYTVRYVRLLGTMIDFLARETGRDANPVRKMFFRLFFAETVTKVVKAEQAPEDLAPLAAHRRATFRTMEPEFLDTFTTTICRDFPKLWATGIADGVSNRALVGANAGEGEDYSTWHLLAQVFIDFIAKTEGKRVSNAAVSENRKFYQELLSQIRG